MRAVAEHVEDRIVWHAAVGPRDPDALWQPIRCGGGISLPGHLQQVPKADICGDCLAAPTPQPAETEETP